MHPVFLLGAFVFLSMYRLESCLREQYLFKVPRVFSYLICTGTAYAICFVKNVGFLNFDYWMH